MVRNDQLLTTNRAERAKRPQKEQGAAVVMWTTDDLGSFLTTTQGHRLHGYFRLAAYTLARRGELMNLRWADVHLGDEHAQGAFVRLRGTVSVINGVSRRLTSVVTANTIASASTTQRRRRRRPAAGHQPG